MSKKRLATLLAAISAAVAGVATAVTKFKKRGGKK